MKIILQAFFFLLIFCASAFGIDCQDYLGGAKFTQTAIQNHPQGQCGGSFSTTFGDSKPLAKALLSSGKAPSWRTHGFWSDSHSFGDSNIPALKKDAASWEPLCQKYDIEYSPFCEHNLQNPDKYLDIAKAAAPSCKIVNTPWKGKLSNKYKNEVHNPGHAVPVGSFNYSYDGTAVVDDDVTKTKAKFSRADKLFFWEPRYNGRWESNDSTPRPQRKGWPDGKLIKSVGVLAKDKGATKLPLDCKINKKTKKEECGPTKWIYKSHSENKGSNDPRAEKPVIIAPVNTKEIKLGNVSCRYYGAFDSGRWRYYCPKWGFEISTVPVPLIVKGKEVGRINPSFRDGSYR